MPHETVPEIEKSSLMQDLQAEVRSHYFMDIFRLRSCEPAGECRAEHTGQSRAVSVWPPVISFQPTAFRILASASVRGDNNRSGDTAELSHLSEIRILVRVRGTRAGGPNLEAGTLMLFSWAEF